MKRFVSFLLAVTMLASMGSNAYGEEGPGSSKRITGLSDSASIDVNGSYEAGQESASVYYVTVAWGDLNFKYDIGGEYEWNPHSLTYDNGTSYQWSNGNRRQVTVTNKSNTAVSVAALAAAETNNHNVTVSVGPASMTLEAGQEGLPTMADSKDFTVMVQATGGPDLEAKKDEPVKVGTITLTVTAAAGEGPQG